MTNPADDALARGRTLARELRGRDDSRIADLLDALCDEIERGRRRLARVGFDLHDEGLQDLTALRNDLQLFRGQVARVLEHSPDVERVVGRVDDFLARVGSLDALLRELAAPGSVPPALQHPLSLTLGEIVAALPGSAVVEVELDPDLDSYDLSDSQRIAVVRVVQSALANVLQHSGATRARVSVRATSDALEVEVLDDGKGFDVEESRRRAAEEHRLGLLGMAERAAMLDGELAVTSRAGGPTRVFLRLPSRHLD